MFSVNIYALIAIVTVAVLVFIVLMYLIKRRYDSIDNFNNNVSDKSKSYAENAKQYSKNLEDSGVKSSNLRKTISDIRKLLKGSL